MPSTFTAIATVTVTSATAATISFTSIPATYTDLALAISTRGDNADNTVSITFNSTSSNRANNRLYSNASTVAGYWTTTEITTYTNRSGTNTTSTFDSTWIYIPNYGNSYKKVLNITCGTERADTNNDMLYETGFWQDTAAITTITLDPMAGDFVQYSTVTLYGIKKA